MRQKFLTSCCSPRYPSAMTTAPGYIVPKLCRIYFLYLKLAFHIVWYTALLLLTVFPCWLMNLLPLLPGSLDFSWNRKKTWGISGLRWASGRLQCSLSPDSIVCRFLRKILKNLFRYIFSYLNVSTTPNVSIYPFSSLFFVPIEAKFPLFLVFLFLCVSPSCPWFDKYFGWLLALVLVCIIHVQLNFWFIKVFLITPPLVFVNTQCFELRFPLTLTFRNAWTLPWRLFRFPLIFLISCFRCDHLFWSCLLFKDIKVEMIFISVNLQWTWSFYFLNNVG